MTNSKSIREIRSEVFTTAWFYFHKGIYTTYGQCLKAAWKAHRIKKQLQSGIINFTFRKATGQTRQAIGTLNNQHFHYTAKGDNRSYNNPDVIKYYDLGKDAWRSFRIERFINIQKAA